MSQNQFGPTFEPEAIPESLSFRLPNGTPVVTAEAAPGSKITIDFDGKPLCAFALQDRSIRVSPYGIVNHDRAQSVPVLRLILAEGRTSLSNHDIWVALYGLWLRNPEEDVLPFELTGVDDAARIYNYLSESEVR
jgi:hypothetical protein